MKIPKRPMVIPYQTVMTVHIRITAVIPIAHPAVAFAGVSPKSRIHAVVLRRLPV
jgi:hypothetical protein